MGGHQAKSPAPAQGVCPHLLWKATVPGCAAPAGEASRNMCGGRGGGLGLWFPLRSSSCSSHPAPLCRPKALPLVTLRGGSPEPHPVPLPPPSPNPLPTKIYCSFGGVASGRCPSLTGHGKLSEKGHRPAVEGCVYRSLSPSSPLPADPFPPPLSPSFQDRQMEGWGRQRVAPGVRRSGNPS